MEIEFHDGPEGLTEAEALFRIVHRLPSTPATEEAAAELERQALGRLGDESEQVRSLLKNPSLLQHLRELKHRYLGPSNRELELARQRSEALERANRAEKASFEALADMAAVTRERDEARQELARVQSELASLRNDVSR